MIEIRLTEISGSTAYPINVYIADAYGNNQVLISTINSAVPPTETYNSENTTIPTIFSYFYCGHYLQILQLVPTTLCIPESCMGD